MQVLKCSFVFVLRRFIFISSTSLLPSDAVTFLKRRWRPIRFSPHSDISNGTTNSLLYVSALSFVKEFKMLIPMKS